MASSIVSAPSLQQQRSSPFPAYQAGPPAASPTPPPPSLHSIRPAAAPAADAAPLVKPLPIDVASSSARASLSSPSSPARSALPSSPTATTTTTSSSSRPQQVDSQQLASAAALAAKREKRRLQTAAKRERARLAASVVDGSRPAPLSAVVPPPSATKAARTKAPAGTSVEVREVLRWSSSSSPAPPFEELADGPAALTASLQRFPSSSSSRSIPSSSGSPPPPPGMSASMTTTTGGEEPDNGPRTPPPPPALDHAQTAGGIVGELLDADELRRLRRKEKTARQKAAKKALAAASAPPAAAAFAPVQPQRPSAAVMSAPKPKALPLKAGPKAKVGPAAFGPLHVSLPTQESPRLASEAGSSSSSSSSPVASVVRLPMTGYRPDSSTPAAIAFVKQRFPSRKKAAAAIVVRLPSTRLDRGLSTTTSPPSASSPTPDDQVRLKPPVRRHSPSPLRIVSPKPVHRAPIALLRPPFLSSPSAAGSVSSRAGSTASFHAGPLSASAAGGGGEYAPSLDSGAAEEDEAGAGSFAVHPELQQPHFFDSAGRFEPYPHAQFQQLPQHAFYPLPLPPPQMVDWQQQQQQQASEAAYAYHPHEYPGACAQPQHGPYGAPAVSASQLPHLHQPPQPPLAYGLGFHPVAHPHHLGQQHGGPYPPPPPQHANVMLPPGYTADGGVYWDPATGQPYLYAYPTPPASSAAPPPPPLPSGPLALPIDGPGLDGLAFIQQQQQQEAALPPFPAAPPPSPPAVTLSQPLPLHLAQRPAFVPRQQTAAPSPSPPAFDPARALGAGGQVYYA